MSSSIRPDDASQDELYQTIYRQASALAAANARVERLEKVLEDLLSWFPDEPSKPEWRLEAGKYGADEAVTAARAALTGGENDR